MDLTKNRKRVVKTADGLGRLRARPGINISWIDLPTKTNRIIGRVYFKGFTLSNEFNAVDQKKTFMVGDKIKMRTESLEEGSYQIVSVFQATKSFSGLWYGNRIEIQKRGHPYVELNGLGNIKQELLPDWLLDPTLQIEIDKSDGVKCVAQYNQVKDPINKWDNKLEAEEVCYYKRRKMHAGNYNPCTPLVYHDDSSDCSYESDCDYTGDLKNMSHAEKPLERLVVHHQVDFSLDTMQAESVPLSQGSLSIIVIDDVMNKNFQVDPFLENIKNRFYSFDFHSSQHRVCIELLKGRHLNFKGEMRKDVFFSAPCGLGKSLCFVVTSYALGGITLVVEPLRALISSQVKQLRGIGVHVEELHTKDAKYPNLPASSYLNTLVDKQCDSPLIIFSTPELLAEGGNCMEAIKLLAKKKLLSLVVVDEFDYYDCCSKAFRGSCVNLVSSLKDNLSTVGVQSEVRSQIPFLFLSATGSSEHTLDHLGSISRRDCSPSPSLFQTSNILPSNHIYRVERKTSLKQAVLRVSIILNDIQRGQRCKGTSVQKKCICYCLTRQNCEIAVNEFEKYGIDAAVFSSEVDENKKAPILARFQKGDLDVLCATSALGRGVHMECSLSFIFHLALPSSLTEYIQATGRGGRGGEVCYCVLFYSPKDISLVKNVLKYSEAEEQQKRLMKISLDNVCKYAIEGKKCRKLLLAHETIAFMLGKGMKSAASKLQNYAFCSTSTMCDNCFFAVTRGESRSKKVEITDVVIGLLLHFPDGFKDDDILVKARKAACMMKVSALPQVRAPLDLLLVRHETKTKTEHSLLSDLVEYCRQNDDGLIDKIRGSRIKFFIQHSKLQEAKSLVDFDPIIPLNPTHFPCCVPKTYPFLIQFEMVRLGLNIEDIFAAGLPEQLSEACTSLFNMANRKPALYIESLGKWCNSNASLSVSYKAELQGNGRLKYLEPERAVDRRMYRMYGSDRFLDVSFARNVSNKEIETFLCSPVRFGGRRYRFFWFKKENGIHAVLFAEEGFGLKPISVSDVQDKCIPKAFNVGLTLGKWVKRMKLNFSDTKVGCKLPLGCVSILNDFDEAGIVAEIDGAGLVSADALHAIWKGFNESSCKSVETSRCPFSGFQGRLAGFKGIWILDSSLHGFALKCRKSQLKYNVPLKCVDSSLETSDDVFEQIEIVSFCRKQETKLNVRVIQILEYYAGIAKKSEALEIFLMSCLARTMSEFKEIASGNVETLKSKLIRMQIDFKCEISHDANVLTRMAIAGVDFDDPEFHRRSTRWLKKQMENTRDKAHYFLSDVVDVRLYPDHTCLLAENEAFLVMDGICCSSKEVIAMRSPSYFAGDMRRLRLVDKISLFKRANISNIDGSLFESQNAFITSILGDAAEASRMSGGDYDGDRVWVCWNEELLSCLPSREKFVPFDTKNLKTKTSELESKLWNQCSNLDLVKYMINFRKHHKILGKLCDSLDCSIDFYGFDDEKTREIGKAAFLQVDMPFNPYESKLINVFEAPSKWPAWKSCKNVSRSVTSSKSVLSKMYSKINNDIAEFFLNQGSSNRKQIPEKIRNCLDIYLKGFENLNYEAKQEAILRRTAIMKMVKEFYESYRNVEFQKALECNEIFYKWQRDYCLNIRKFFVQDKVCDSNRIPLLHAAIFYVQCFKMEKCGNYCRKCEFSVDFCVDCLRMSENSIAWKACEFAWNVCLDELTEIFSGKNHLTVSCENSKYFK